MPTFKKKTNSISSLLHPRWCISGAVPLTPTVSVWCSPGCGHQRAPHFINLSWVVGATRGTGRYVNSIGRFSVWVAPSMLLVAAVPFPAAIRITAGLHCQTWLRGFFLLQHVLHYPPQNKWATQDHCDKQTNKQTHPQGSIGATRDVKDKFKFVIYFFLIFFILCNFWLHYICLRAFSYSLHLRWASLAPFLSGGKSPSLQIQWL